jgi:glycosyltransferase involved in cell wall biosynthesis
VKNRLLLIVDSGVIGGVARMVVNLAQGLSARNWEVRTVFPAWANEEFVAWCRNQGFEPELSPMLGAWSASGVTAGVKGQLRLQSFIRSARADVVNFHYSGSIISPKDILAARLAGVSRCIASVHLVARWNLERPFRKPMTAIAGALCDRVVAVSAAAAQGELDAGVPRSRVIVIPNGAQSPVSPITQAEARARLGVGPDEFIAGAAVRLAPVKRLQDLIEAIGLLHAEGIRVRAIIAGEGPERAALESLARSRADGAIEFLGLCPDPTELYLASDVVVLPSELEGQPNMPMEAALCERPCIGTAIGGTSEVITDGITGFLVPVAAPQEIARCLKLLYADRQLARRMGAAALKRAREEFTSDRMVSRYAEVLSPPRRG